MSLLRAAGLKATIQPVPTASSIERAADDRLAEHLRAQNLDDEARQLAVKLLSDADPAQVVAALLSQSVHRGPCAARRISSVSAPPEKRRQPRETNGRHEPRRARPGSYVTFQVSWGTKHGADPRRMLALVCRRGRVTRRDIGSIQLARASSTVQVATECAETLRPRSRNRTRETRE